MSQRNREDVRKGGADAPFPIRAHPTLPTIASLKMTPRVSVEVLSSGSMIVFLGSDGNSSCRSRPNPGTAQADGGTKDTDRRASPLARSRKTRPGFGASGDGAVAAE